MGRIDDGSGLALGWLLAHLWGILLAGSSLGYPLSLQAVVVEVWYQSHWESKSIYNKSMKSTLGYRREKPEHHKPESDPPKPRIFVVGVPLLHHQAVCMYSIWNTLIARKSYKELVKVNRCQCANTTAGCEHQKQQKQKQQKGNNTHNTES